MPIARTLKIETTTNAAMHTQSNTPQIITCFISASSSFYVQLINVYVYKLCIYVYLYKLYIQKKSADFPANPDNLAQNSDLFRILPFQINGGIIPVVAAQNQLLGVLFHPLDHDGVFNA